VRVCCSVSGALVDALRDLFMSALRRQIKPFKRVLIETSGLADPSTIIFSLRNDPFLSERYVYAGALLVADVRRIAQQLQTQPEAVRQAVLADGVVFSKTDVAQVDDQQAAALSREGGEPRGCRASGVGRTALA
jgi:G3E family GTPase